MIARATTKNAREFGLCKKGRREVIRSNYLSINQLPPSATTYFPENKIWGIFTSIHTISSPPSTPFSFPHHHQRTITLNSATDFEHQIIWL
jgi:hypothetical protein